MHVVGRVAAGETVLIHAAASGVGIAAIQLVIAAGATPLVTVGSREKLEKLVSLVGAAGGAVRTEGPWLPTISELLPAGRKGVDLVLDPVASGYAKQNLEVLAIDGRWVLYVQAATQALTTSCHKQRRGGRAPFAPLRADVACMR